MTVLSPSDEAIRDLTQTQHVVRVKKLMVYACTHHWVADEHLLSGYHFHELIQHLLTICPTSDQLNEYFKHTVATLTKPAEYALIAHVITQHLQRIYIHTHSSDLEQAECHSTILSDLYVDVAHGLEHDGDRNRIKKLLIYICQNHWENNPNQLDAFSIAGLIRDTYNLVPTPDALNAALISVIKTLNKRDEYTRIAHKITASFMRIYQNDDTTDDESLISTSPIEPPSKHSQACVSSASTHSSNQRSPNAHHDTAHPTSSNATSAIESPQLNEPPNLFNLRIEIVKYTNPLRAKVLIFAAISGGIECCDRNWLFIKHRELDDLLISLLQVASTFRELENHLNGIAKASQESNRYLQAASAILRAIKVVYFSSKPSLGQGAALTYQITQINPVGNTQPSQEQYLALSCSQSRRNQSHDEEQEDQTCQIKPSSDRPSDSPQRGPHYPDADTLMMPCPSSRDYAASEDETCTMLPSERP
ncbi:MAG: hypothetical protein ACFE0I_15270 [Elainellaceae cyanobacterium]